MVGSGLLFWFSYPHDSHVVGLARLSRRPSAPSAVQRVHADVAVLPRRHGQRLSCRVGVGDEVAQLLLGNVQALANGRVAHLHHGAQEVEVPRSVGASTQQDEKDEHERIAQNYNS